MARAGRSYLSLDLEPWLGQPWVQHVQKSRRRSLRRRCATWMEMTSAWRIRVAIGAQLRQFPRRTLLATVVERPVLGLLVLRTAQRGGVGRCCFNNHTLASLNIEKQQPKGNNGIWQSSSCLNPRCLSTTYLNIFRGAVTRTHPQLMYQLNTP